ncbi:transposase [Acinetobacter pittii]|nr:transposase [Acinetobacter pittii]
MCRVLKIARAGYYAWLHEPESGRTIEDKRLLQLIRSSYDASYGIYGYRRITLDLKELGESCGPNRVLKIMKNNGIAAVRGYKKHKSYGCGRPPIVPPKALLQITTNGKLKTVLAKGAAYESFPWSAFSGRNHSLGCALVL